MDWLDFTDLFPPAAGNGDDANEGYEGISSQQQQYGWDLDALQQQEVEETDDYSPPDEQYSLDPDLFPPDLFPELYANTFINAPPPPVIHDKAGPLFKFPTSFLPHILNIVTMDKGSLGEVRRVCRSWKKFCDPVILQHIYLTGDTVNGFLDWTKPAPCNSTCSHPPSQDETLIIHHPNTQLGLIRKVEFKSNGNNLFPKRIFLALDKCINVIAILPTNNRHEPYDSWKDLDSLQIDRKESLTHLDLFPYLEARWSLPTDLLKRNLEFAKSMFKTTILSNLTSMRMDLSGIQPTEFTFKLLKPLINVKVMELAMTRIPRNRDKYLLHRILISLPVKLQNLRLVIDATYIVMLDSDFLAQVTNLKRLVLKSLRRVELIVTNSPPRVTFEKTNAEFKMGIRKLLELFFSEVVELSVRSQTTTAIYTKPTGPLNELFPNWIVVSDFFNWVLHAPRQINGSPENPILSPSFYNHLVHLKLKPDSVFNDVLKAAANNPGILDRLESLMIVPHGPHQQSLDKTVRLLKYCRNITYFACTPFFDIPPMAMTRLMASVKGYCRKLRVLKLVCLNVLKLKGEHLERFSVGMEALVGAVPKSLVSLVLEDDVVPWDMKQEWVRIARGAGLRVLGVMDPFECVSF
ncbi:hypothetical protein HDU76_005258 [Blyttiomyces sp. JEL0837]|nr:hypothetical protein HDU76_005258 [Blyttiomyces sp. JEL0837]